jgi:transposase
MKKGKKKKPGKRKKRAKHRYNRCIKRYSLRVNHDKWKLLLELVQAYNQQKDAFLVSFSGLKKISACKRFRQVRNNFVRDHYESPFGLQGRLWKLALKDGLEMLDRYWSAQRACWKEKVFKADISDKQKHYLFKSLKTYANLETAIFHQKGVSLGLELEKDERKKALKQLHKWINQTVKNKPRVKICRSFIAEPETYRIFEYKGRQYIAVTTSIPGKRVIIPLTGKSRIKGQIKVVFDFQRRRVEIHSFVQSRRGKSEGEKKGIDLGITEVFTDSDGDRWGTDFGSVLAKYSDRQKEKGKKRNKLYALRKKHIKNKRADKARKITKFNVGKSKQINHHRKQKTHLSEIVNKSINDFFNAKHPAKVIAENLSAMRGKTKSKRLSRLVSAWIRNIIKNRLDFKVSHRGSVIKLVNPAYSSQICFRCGWVHRGNRSGDRFKCLFCGYKALSDWMAALELLRRDGDLDIFLWTPKEQVKNILRERFRHRLDSWDFSFSPSQANWAGLRRVFKQEFIDGLVKKHLSGKGNFQ